MKITTTTSIIVSLSALISSANGASLRITVEASSNVGLAPALLSFHNGSVDFFDTGSAASAGLELLAEVGDTSVLQASLAAGSDNITIANGGPFTPGSSNTVTFDISDTNTLLSFAAMVLPSNDWFIGNNNAIDISSVIGGGLGATSILEFGRVYD
ncbi:spondin domain-containing protein, partial [bacterium]|nr:spondin domain-containing protein [bacterium]